MPTPTPIRDLTRDAIERAWQRAVTAGALPALPADPAPPEVEVERPASAEHGDLSTNLAMKLARPYRMSPLAIATVLAAELDAEAKTSPATTPIAQRDGGATRLRQPATGGSRPRERHRSGPGRRAWMGTAPAAGTSAQGERGVRVGESDRAPAHRQRPRCLRRRPALSRPRSGRPGGHPRVLLQRLWGPDRRPRCVGRGAAPRRRAPRGRLPRRLRGRTRGRTPWRRLDRGDHSGRGHRRPRRPLGRRSQFARGSSGACPRWGSRSTSGPARRASTTRAGWIGRSSGFGRTATSTNSTVPCGSDRRHSATTRIA